MHVIYDNLLQVRAASHLLSMVQESNRITEWLKLEGSLKII